MSSNLTRAMLGSSPNRAIMKTKVHHEVIDDISIWDVEVADCLPGTATHTKLASIPGWGHVYIDVDKNEKPLAITIITTK